MTKFDSNRSAFRNEFSDAELLAFLDEQLGAKLSAAIESALRDDEALRTRLTQLRGQNLAGLHTIGAIWRQERLSCPDRETLRRFLLGELPADHAGYIRFHLSEIGCRVCNANHDDLNQAMRDEQDSTSRRRRMFQTSAGHLK
ncbi:hypothetical protein [Rhodopirellula sallentina]|uniref:Uncharacterized protein n=1 Tax=Rhodopirellula sallentina SM41 TaxID=1263870 RepID=M5TVS0_9BACT|nr:hypothetical protein [Rhodopirellula sallentina]EMI53149.1 hypothetical protein RSSM_05414 [Rhodopirellula sallentina SM41]